MKCSIGKKSIGLSTTTASWIRNLSLATCMVCGLSSPSLAAIQAIQDVEIVGRPIVRQDRVTIRVKTKGENGRPIIGLKATDFSLKVDDADVDFNSRDWKSPNDSNPPPAWVIVLLDFSGSMNSRDTQGTTKLEGAITAIREYVDTLEKRGGAVEVSIVPFGKSGTDQNGTRCDGNAVTPEKLNNFFAATAPQLKNSLDYLAAQKPCASTDLYGPLEDAVQFFSNSADTRFVIPEESSEPDPRLSIILLSDGYHNGGNDAEEFENLRNLLKRNTIVIHTLGYGLTPEELGNQYGLGRPATRDDIGTGANDVKAEEFVDRDRLRDIANLTGGVSEFSGEASEIAANLQVFLDALFGEYEITYTEPNPERGAEREVRAIVDDDPSDELYPVVSPSKKYRMGVFWWPVALKHRLPMLGIIFATMAIGGVLPFAIWARYLKRQQ